VQAPLWHLSVPLQTLASAHEVPLGTGAFEQPVDGLQLSVVQTLASLQERGVPAVHPPLWQISAPLQALASLHEVPFRTGACSQPKTGSQVSVVQGLASLQLSAAPAVHTPLWQVSSPLQTLPSAHDAPLGTGTV
jgi:hypothetical protein